MKVGRSKDFLSQSQFSLSLLCEKTRDFAAAKTSSPGCKGKSIYTCEKMSSDQYQPIPMVPASAVMAEDYGEDSNQKSSSSYGGYGSTTTATANIKFDDKGDPIIIAKGEIQTPAFRDGWFGILFLTQLAVVITLTILYATGKIHVQYDFDDLNINDDDTGKNPGRRFLKKATSTTESTANPTAAEEMEFPSLRPLLMGCLSCLMISPILTITLFSCLAKNAARLMEVAIYSTIAMNGLLVLICLFSGNPWPAIGPGMIAFFTILYARTIWSRIPLAAANLKTAITAIQSQLGVAFIGLASVPFHVIWTILWCFFFISTLCTTFMSNQIDHNPATAASGGHTTTTSGIDDDDGSPNALWYLIVFLMTLSFYWTHQVIGNTVQSSVAGATGTFWFVPEEAIGCCSSGLTSSLYRSLTYSFGSICMGSLIVAIIQALRSLVKQVEENARNNDGGGAILLCLVECLLNMLESAAEYFNKWAFIYVGLYGYGYMEAGHNVLTLFRERGWTSIITDDLTSRVLGMMIFAVGMGTGLIGGLLTLVSGSLMSSSSSSDQEAYYAMAIGTLVLGIIIGMVLSSIMFAVVNSAADTIIVLFAEAPLEFQQNHPNLAAEMNYAWSKAYPTAFRPISSGMVV